MMKNILFKLILVSLLAMLFDILYSETGWKIISASGYNFKVNIAGFLTPMDGITAGYGGEVHYTTDGGKTWPAGNNESWCRFGLEILDATNAWTSGNAGHVRVSHDGGVNWMELERFGPNEPDECRYLSFVDPLNGWIAAPGRLAATDDGAKTWKKMVFPAGMKLILAMDLLSKSQGYIFASDGALFITKDAGKTWKKMNVDLKDKNLYSEEMLPTLPIAAMRFQNDTDGILVLMTVQPRSWNVLNTADGGKTWKTEGLPQEVSGLNGSVYLSRDGSYLTFNDIDNNKIYLLSRQ